MFTTINLSLDLVLVTLVVGFFLGVAYTAGCWLISRVLR